MDEKSKNTAEKKLSTEAYKGVRDFYPEDMFVQKYMFDKMRKTVESFGYVEYGASILEPTELYKAKSGEEIINEQTYSFIDRGERDVTLRPEMTPTVARMVAGRKRELAFPLRWYSIPNLFRYEQPQRGRLREHWQLNVDLFGVNNTVDADIEIISVAYQIMKNFSTPEKEVTDKDFTIEVNNRELWNSLCKSQELSQEQQHLVSKLIDKKNKIDPKIFNDELENILGKKTPIFLELANEWNINNLPQEIKTTDGHLNISNILSVLEDKGIKAIYNPTIMRGFDYYTGMIFEVRSTDSINKRAMFGGGRYDNLTGLFSDDKVPAVGFGMGDVTMRDFLETHNLMPTYKSSAELYLCNLDQKFLSEISTLAQRLRDAGVNVAVDFRDKKIGDQIKTAEKQKVPFVICIGENEITSKKYTVKNLETREETVLGEKDIAPFIKK